MIRSHLYFAFQTIEKKLNGREYFAISIFSFALLSLVIGANRGIEALTYSAHDDRLFLGLASNILKGSWLGDYNQFTLAKGCFYPLFIAFNFLLGFPLLFSQHVLYIASALLLLISLKFFIKSRVILLIIFIVCIYSPSYFSDTRVLREDIYTSLTVMVLASVIGWLGNLYKSIKQKRDISYAWSICLGITSGLFWLTREEGIWILPTLVFIFINYVIKLFFCIRKKEIINKRNAIATLILPVVFFLLPANTVSAMNFAKYGVFIPVDMHADGYVKANSALMRIKSEYIQFIPVTREAREKSYQISPSFSKLKPFLEQPNGYTKESCRWIPNACKFNDYGGGWFIWALRDAVTSIGYYNKNAIETDKFYQSISQEIDKACDEKKLDCTSYRRSLVPAFRLSYVKPILKSFIQSFQVILTRDKIEPNKYSEGDKQGIAFYADITHNRINPVNNSNEYIQVGSLNELVYFEIQGWAFFKDDPVQKYSIEVKSENGLVDFKPEYLASPDLVEYFNNKEMKNSRFSLKGVCKINDCKISFLKDKESQLKTTESNLSIYVKDIQKNGQQITSSTLLNLNFDYINIFPLYSSVLSMNKDEISLLLSSQEKSLRLNMFKYEFVNFIISIYNFLFPVLFLIALPVLAITAIYRLRNVKIIDPLSVITFSLLLAVFTRIFVFSYVNVSLYPAVNLGYLRPCIPPTLVFTILSYTYTAKIFMKKSKVN